MAIKAAEMETIDRGMTLYSEVEEDDFTDEERALMAQTEELMESRARPVDETV